MRARAAAVAAVSLEPGIAGLVLGSESAIAAPDWAAYRACRICAAAPGEPCVAKYGRIVDGRPVAGPRALQVAHGHRKRVSGR